MVENRLSERLGSLLKENHMSQKELAERVKITEASLSYYVKGTRVPRSAVLARIASELGTTSEYLLGGDETEVQDEIGLARRLIARNADQMSAEQKNDLIKILLMTGK